MDKERLTGLMVEAWLRTPVLITPEGQDPIRFANIGAAQDALEAGQFDYPFNLQFLTGDDT